MIKVGAFIGAWVLGLFALAGCKSDKPEATAAPTTSAAPGASASAAAPASKPKPGKEINLFAWSEYVPQEVIDGFTKETGIKVNYETYASNEEMLSKLLAESTKYDLIQPSE